MKKQNKVIGKRKEHGPFTDRPAAIRMARRELGEDAEVDKDFFLNHPTSGTWWYWSEAPFDKPKAKDARVASFSGGSTIEAILAMRQLGLFVYGMDRGARYIVSTAPLSRGEVTRLARKEAAK